MIYAMVYAENGEIIGTYGSRDEAVRKLAAFVSEHRDEPALEILRDHVAQRPLV
jgi:hypothetical protein